MVKQQLCRSSGYIALGFFLIDVSNQQWWFIFNKGKTTNPTLLNKLIPNHKYASAECKQMHLVD